MPLIPEILTCDELEESSLSFQRSALTIAGIVAHQQFKDSLSLQYVGMAKYNWGPNSEFMIHDPSGEEIAVIVAVYLAGVKKENVRYIGIRPDDVKRGSGSGYAVVLPLR